MLYIIIAVIIFGVLIAVHELGHFAAAKSVGVRVNEFAIGMGPAIFKKRRGDTLYSLRCLPIGGYCAMEGEDELSEDPRSFTSAKAWKRFVILAAGSLMNFIAGFLIILIVFISAAGFYTPTIRGFDISSDVEARSGLREGDRIISVDGERIFVSSDIYTLLSRAPGDTVKLTIERGGERMVLKSGLRVKDIGSIEWEIEKAGFFTNIKYAWLNSRDFVRLVRLSLMDLLRGVVGLRDLSGPIGIVGVMSDVGKAAPSASEAIGNILFLGAFIAVNLSVMNMLPIPALDGGRIFFLIITTIIEKVGKRKVNPKYEGYIHAAGLVFFFGLMALVALNDILKLISG
ncbi:MAG: M50 family metallopeptidase [Oscillospiraceae bacterium]|jgi:regulator of sigma E protease